MQKGVLWIGLAALLNACAAQEETLAPGALDESMATERAPSSVSETDRQLAQLIIVRSQNAALKQGLREAQLAYPEASVEVELDAIDPALSPDSRVDRRSAPTDDLAVERQKAFLEAENRALRLTLDDAGAPIPDHEEWKEPSSVGMAFAIGPIGLKLVHASSTDDIWPRLERPDISISEEQFILDNEIFRTAYRADPKATLDLIRRILGSGETAQ